MLWIFGLQLIVTGYFNNFPTYLVGIVPVLITLVLAVWTCRMVVNETRINLIQNNSAAAETKDAPQRTRMVVRSRNGDTRIMVVDEFDALYKPITPATLRLGAIDPLLAEEGFKAYKSTAKVWSHQLTPADIRADFPKERFISRSGASVSAHSGQYIVIPFPQGDTVTIINEQQFQQKYNKRTDDLHDSRVVSQAEALQKWEPALRREGSIYAKSAKVHAKRMAEEGYIEAEVDGIEARRWYAKGDYLVCGSRGGRYLMSERQFTSRYHTARPDPASDPVLASAGFLLFEAKGKVRLRHTSYMV